jgi:hypothetical protein
MDTEDIEKELRSISPVKPSSDIFDRVERALGEAGTVAMCHLPEEPGIEHKGTSPKFMHFLSFVGIAALLVSGIFISINLLHEHSPENNQNTNLLLTQPSNMVEDEDSPIHGLTTEQLEGDSDLPTVGWLDPFTEQRLIMKVDEGVIDRASGIPARQFRYHYLDETLWTHPASETRVLSTTPRQEIYLIDLELY